MYLIVAFAITVIVMMVAWRGLGRGNGGNGGGRGYPDAPERPTPPPARRVLAPDDDPEFLSELDRMLREQGKNSQ